MWIRAGSFDPGVLGAAAGSAFTCIAGLRASKGRVGVDDKMPTRWPKKTGLGSVVFQKRFLIGVSLRDVFLLVKM